MLGEWLAGGTPDPRPRSPRGAPVSRQARLWIADAKQNPIPLPEGLLYLSLPGSGIGGVAPPGEMVDHWAQCGAALILRLDDPRRPSHTYDPECTLARGHDGPHVAHIGPYAPVAAWTDQEGV